MKYKKLLLLIVLLVFTLSLTAKAGIDTEVREIVLETDKGLLDQSMSVITHLGDTKVIIPAILLTPKETRKDALVGFAVSQLITDTLKYSIGKTRPNTGKREFIPFSGHKSFPSGHATGAFAFATAIAENHPKYKKIAYTVATLVAVSRLYEDKHWISDVVVGSAIGHYTTKYLVYKLEW